ncbi:MAG: nucleotidyltransferase domain-containing protein [Lachnospiraceae bacterium]|nr:nucleotidyltransferase domain-containing protein [Lachnospiraceae bacterium]
MKALEKMSMELSVLYGALLDRIILYGSYARMEETPESDVDIAILLRNGSTEKMHDDMIDIVVDYELELGLVLSVVPIDYQNYSMWKKVLPYYKKINGEGILLWKAA